MADTDDRSIHLDLDLELRGDEVHGRAATVGRPDRDFTGWVGLIAALDALVERRPEPPS